MMSYNLAKQLKDAGFPQMGDGFMLMLHDPKFVEDLADQTVSRIERCKYVMLGKYNIYGEDVYEPTLSELLRAFGDVTIKLWINGNGRQSGVQLPLQSLDTVIWYDTPEEAVTHAWITVNNL